MNLDRLFKFSNLVGAFQKIERTLYIPGTDRHENDVEHSYHLAMTAWYLIRSEKLTLDLDVVLKYALIHDLVEVYAGDTFVFSNDAGHVESKHERELAAAKRLEEEFPEFPDMHSTIQEYEKRESREAKFVYALDKVLPILINYEGKGRAWKEHGVTLERLKGEKENKISLSPEIVPYFDALIELLTKEEGAIF
ncbi:MAG: metal dependent phosphohydrolase, putative hydrolase of superfamily [Parcubacteria group bacterium]|nr:metal dependent phosphohydrolase, putative hydrolase of superfamily [Parcubacteria group bacterium]